MGGTFTKQRVALGVAAALLVGGVGACYPGSISDVGEADLVITVYDTAFDFATVQTYFMPDTIVRVGEDDEDIDGEFDDDILDEIADQFAALGYQRIFEGGGEPDVFVAVGTSSSTFGWWVPGGCWWCWYPGYPGWTPGWPGYPGYPGYPWYPGYGGTYQTGSLGVAMVNPVAPPVEGERPAVYWGGVINGLLSSTNANTAARVIQNIDQMFEQSPYLAGPSNPLPN